MQRTLAECPGFLGTEPPGGPQAQGTVVVEPALALEARIWLRRRFLVCDDVELSSDTGLVFKILPRVRAGQARRCRISFAKPVQ